MTLVLTLFSLIFLIIRHKGKTDWLHIGYGKYGVYEALALKVTQKKSIRHIFTWHLGLEIIILLIFPWPYVLDENSILKTEATIVSVG